ncbi:MAG: cold shock domain-containing protein [Candidatus Methanofastidiosia archaeon]|jgi:CspA family cold shock protein
MKGVIQWYSPRKGYGFIEVEGEEDVFVHRSEVPMGIFLDEGDLVEFEKEETEKGPRAVNVQKL